MKLMRLGALGLALIRIHLRPSKVAAAFVNRTIDDQRGDSVTGREVLYYPTNAWNDQTCNDKCSISPDKSLAFYNTYTAATYFGPNTASGSEGVSQLEDSIPPSPRDPSTVGSESIGISMQFIGTAIHVFFILANFINTSTLNSANFSVDGNAPVLFASIIPVLPTLTPQYRVMVFCQTNLSNTLHTLNITTSGPVGDIYVNFDYAIYTYDNDVSTTTSSLSSLSTVTTTSQVPSTTVTSPPPRRTPVDAIVGGTAGGIALLALVIALLFCWHRRRGHGALQSVSENGSSEPLLTQFNGGGGSLAVSASGMLFGDELSNADNQADMRNNYQTLHSGEVVLSLPGSQQLPSSEKALPSSTSSSSVLGTSTNNRSTSPLLPSPLNVTGTREEVRRARQKDLDDRLRVVQNNIVQLEGSNAGHGRSMSLRRQNSEEAEIIEEDTHMSVPDMHEVIRSLKMQIRVLREQQQSAWALGLSDDPPPGYTPMEVGMQISREASS